MHDCTDTVAVELLGGHNSRQAAAQTSSVGAALQYRAAYLSKAESPEVCGSTVANQR